MPIVGAAINYGLANLQAPVSGVTHSVKVTANLNNETVTLAWASLAQVVGDFRPQAMTVDNTHGTAVVVVSETVYGWSRSINPGVAQTFQFPAIPNGIFTLQTTGVVTGLVWSFFDWPAFPDVWTNAANSALGTAVTISGQPINVDVLAMPAQPSGNFAAGATHTVVTGGTAVTVFAGNSIGGLPGSGGYAVIKNPDTATETLYVDAVNAAQTAEPGSNGTTIGLAPGASITFQPCAQNITANAATNGHTFVAYKYGA